MAEIQLLLNPWFRAPRWSQLSWQGGYDHPEFFVEGTTVYARVKIADEFKSARCTVKLACGDMAMIVNENLGINTWVHLHDVFIKKTDIKE